MLLLYMAKQLLYFPPNDEYISAVRELIPLPHSAVVCLNDFNAHSPPRKSTSVTHTFIMVFLVLLLLLILSHPEQEMGRGKKSCWLNSLLDLEPP